MMDNPLYIEDTTKIIGYPLNHDTSISDEELKSIVITTKQIFGNNHDIDEGYSSCGGCGESCGSSCASSCSSKCSSCKTKPEPQRVNRLRLNN